MVVKSIVIIAGGMADNAGGAPTPMSEASIPAMRLLAGEGEFGTSRAVEFPFVTDDVNSLLSFFGYDLHKGIPSRPQLRSLAQGIWPEEEDSEISFIMLPVFSYHGSLLSPVEEARGIGRLAQLDVPLLGGDPEDWASFATLLASEAIERSKDQDLVVVYLDWAARAAFGGDPAMKREAIEIIDQNLVSPIADYVWRSDEFIELCVTSGYATSWESRAYLSEKVPLLLYFNDSAPQRNLPVAFNETVAEEGSLHFHHPRGVLEKWIGYAADVSERFK